MGGHGSKLEVSCRGFSLIELLLVLVITGILASVAVPGYMTYQRRAVATEGVMSLLGLATLQERLKFLRGRYQSAQELLGHRPLSDRVGKHYRLNVELPSAGDDYLLTLEPFADDYPRMSLDSAGRRSPDELWP